MFPKFIDTIQFEDNWMFSILMLVDSSSRLLNVPMSIQNLQIWVLFLLLSISIKSHGSAGLDHHQHSWSINNATVQDNSKSSNLTRMDKNRADSVKLSILGDCTRCRLISNSLFEIIRKSFFDHDAGSDLNAHSKLSEEMDFNQIWSKLCFNIKAGRDDCRSFAEENQDKIFAWWQHQKQVFFADPDSVQGEFNFLNPLCIEMLKVCCQDGHYGPQCLRCNGYPDKVCSNNGKCAGAGTRLGNGHCICNIGYDGANCDQCDRAYFQNRTMLKHNGTIQCLPCDQSCSGSCFDGGPKGCHVCRNGFAWVIDSGCVDVDECSPEHHQNPCAQNSFCINTEGSYSCYQCDPACDGCDGDGPDSCLKCANDHVLKDGVCMNPDPKPLMTPYASPARYITYFGLCLVTCIIFRHNILVASAIGLAVALYIMASEKSLETEYGRAFDRWWSKVSGQN